jgi:TetR/AcrR family transcriptional regulator
MDTSELNPLAIGDRDPRRIRLLRAAITEFAERGYYGARVNMIADVAGVNKQLIYHYFGGKDELYRAALAEAYALFLGDSSKLEEELRNLEPTLALKRFLEDLFTLTKNSVLFQRLLQDENMHGGNVARTLDWVPASYDNLIAILSEVLNRGLAAGVFRRIADHREFYVTIVGIFGIRLTNAHTLAFSIGVPLDTPEGAETSRKAAIDFILNVTCALAAL